MNIPRKVIKEYQILLAKSLDGGIADAEIQRLNQIMQDYSEIETYYYKCIAIHIALRQSRVFSVQDQDLEMLDELLQELVKCEKKAPSIDVPVKVDSTSPTVIKNTAKPKLQSVKSHKTLPLLAAVCAITLIMLILGAQVQDWFAPVEVATVTDMLDAKVEGQVLTAFSSRLTDKSSPISLTTGLMKILFDNGVRIVVEGPAEFQVKSAKHIFLNEGKLYARVSELGHGFRVDTLSSSIVDLGTEFGVQVSHNHSSTIHMVSGRATLESKRKSQESASQLLTEGQARNVTTSGKITTIDMEETRFVRDINAGTQTYWCGEWLTIVALPTQNTDQASGIRKDTTYTHLLDFGDDQGTVINGVVFTPVDFNEPYDGVLFRDDSLDLTLTRIGAKSFNPFRNERHIDNADGGMQMLLSDSIFLSVQPLSDHYALTLTGLDPGRKYSLRLYYCTDQKEPVRSIRLVFNGQGHDKEILVDQQAGGANYIRYDYTASSEQVEVTLHSLAANRSWHLYGLSNEVVEMGY